MKAIVRDVLPVGGFHTDKAERPERRFKRLSDIDPSAEPRQHAALVAAYRKAEQRRLQAGG